MTSLRSSLSEFLHRKDSLLAQFVKYVLCGGVSVLIVQLTLYALAWLALPALRPGDPVAQALTAMGFTVREVSDEVLRRNYWIIMVICFVVSNAVVYVLNVLFVFHAGRHKRSVEVAMFFAFSLVQFFYIWLGSVLIIRFGWHVTYANISMLVLGTVTNYVVRKKIVFKG